MVKRGDLSDAEKAKLGSSGHLMMTIGGAWFGDYYYKKIWKMPSHSLAVAPMPTWPGQSQPYSGATGGGIYVVSRHSKNLKGAAEIAQWMSSNVDYQATAVTLPAYGPAQDAWGKRNVAKDPLWAEDPMPVFKAQSQLIRPSPTFEYVRFDPGQLWTQDVTPPVQSGKPVSSVIDKLQSDSVQLAKSNGYSVSTS